MVNNTISHGKGESIIQFNRWFFPPGNEMMDIDFKKKYKILMNWGVFADPNDISDKYLYGARKLDHTHNWNFFPPTGAGYLKVSMQLLLSSALLFALLY